MTFTDKSTYSGEWQDSKKHGKGLLRWRNGALFEGGWRSGKEHGEGIKVYDDGSKIEGVWKMGKYSGIMTTTTLDGTINRVKYSEDGDRIGTVTSAMF